MISSSLILGLAMHTIGALMVARAYPRKNVSTPLIVSILALHGVIEHLTEYIGPLGNLHNAPIPTAIVLSLFLGFYYFSYQLTNNTRAVTASLAAFFVVNVFAAVSEFGFVAETPEDQIIKNNDINYARSHLVLHLMFFGAMYPAAATYSGDYLPSIISPTKKVERKET